MPTSAYAKLGLKPFEDYATILPMATDTRLCFVVSPIGAEGSATRKRSDALLNSIIRPALLPELGYVVKRADEDFGPGTIAEQIVRDLVFADLVIADLTDHNPNVFYELGIRHAAIKPTIHLAQVGTLLPFDNYAYRTIFYDLTDSATVDRALYQLQAAVMAVNEKTYRVRNHVTHASVPLLLREYEMSDNDRCSELMRLFSELREVGTPIDLIMEFLSRRADKYDGIRVEIDHSSSKTYFVVHLKNGKVATPIT